MRVRSDLLVIVKEKEIKEMSIKLACRDDTLCLNLMPPENSICKVGVLRSFVCILMLPIMISFSPRISWSMQVYANVTHQEGKF